MKITNRMGLPKTLMNAVERDDYTMGAARMSVTGLLKPPRIGILWKQHNDKIEHDVVDSIWSLFGRAIHKILEHGADEEHLSEERLFATVRGWVISGQIDLQKITANTVKIVDYKSTNAYAVMQEKKEWVEQINTYRWLLETATDYKVTELAVCAFVKDWNRHKAAENPDYPQAVGVMVPIPLWSMAAAGAFVEERVRVHQAAQAAHDMGDEPPHCTDEERWMRTASYAVKKVGNKRPTKVHSSSIEAEKHRAALGDGYVVETRKGEPIRCTGNYCSVSKWCSQFQEWSDKHG